MSLKDRVLIALHDSRQVINFTHRRITMIDDPTLELDIFNLPRYDVDVYENGIKQPVSDPDRQEIVNDLLADRLWKDTMPNPPPPRP